MGADALLHPAAAERQDLTMSLLRIPDLEQALTRTIEADMASDDVRVEAMEILAAVQEIVGRIEVLASKM